METTFPSGLGWATAFYLTVYLATFVLHQAFMHYVLAGSLYVAWATIRRGRDPLPLTHQPLAADLRDWMPFLLSAAITAGVAPLLFIQIVYQFQFYSANLLLWWRWMVLIPVLIAAFYLLYLLKSHLLWKWSYPVQVFVAVGTATCFVFAGFCWTVNHLLGNNSSAWNDVYLTGRLPFGVTTILPRMLIWLAGSFTSMTVVAAWQLVYRSKTDAGEVSPPKQLASMAIGGVLIAVVAALLYLSQCESQVRNVVLGPAFRLWIVVLVVGVAAQVAGWLMQVRSRLLGGTGLILASVSTLTNLIATAVVREGLRIATIDLNELSPRHAAATTMGGFWIFIMATAVVGGLIVFCVRLVMTGTPPPGVHQELDSVRQ